MQQEQYNILWAIPFIRKYTKRQKTYLSSTIFLKLNKQFHEINEMNKVPE